MKKEKLKDCELNNLIGQNLFNQDNSFSSGYNYFIHNWQVVAERLLNKNLQIVIDKERNLYYVDIDLWDPKVYGKSYSGIGKTIGMALAYATIEYLKESKEKIK